MDVHYGTPNPPKLAFIKLNRITYKNDSIIDSIIDSQFSI